jgi:hypothetical protein
MTRKKKPKAGDLVLLKGLPPGFVDDLPRSDQRALTNAIGTSVLLLGYDEDGRAELEFTDNKSGSIHSIFVTALYYEPIPRK